MLIPTALVDTTVDGKTFTTATSTQEGSSSQLFPQGFKGEGETQQPFISEESKSSEEANSDLDSDSDSDWSQSDAPRGKYTIYQCMTNGMNFKVNHDVNVGLSGQVPQVVELESTLTNYYTPRSESDSPHCAAAFADYVRAKESEPEAISRLKELRERHLSNLVSQIMRTKMACSPGNTLVSERLYDLTRCVDQSRRDAHLEWTEELQGKFHLWYKFVGEFALTVAESKEDLKDLVSQAECERLPDQMDMNSFRKSLDEQWGSSRITSDERIILDPRLNGKPSLFSILSWFKVQNDA